jgi:lysophospholipase L1-like esterase
MSQKLGNTVLLLVSCGLALLLLEFAVRILDIPPNPLPKIPASAYRLSSDPIIRYEYQPGYSHNGYSINRAGFRDHDYEEHKPPGTYRIVVLGDSTTAGNGVPNLDQTYTKRLEKLLNKHGLSGVHYEVLNMGVGGYDTLQEVETLRVKGLRYNPDMVILAICVNDFDFGTDGGVYNALLVKKRNSFLSHNALYSRLLEISRLAFILHYVFSPTLYSEENKIYLAENQKYIKKFLTNRTTVRAGFELLSLLQQKYRFTLLTFILPSFENRFDEYKMYSIHDRVFHESLGLKGITIIDLLDNFARVNNAASVFSFDGTHMNQYGHDQMAKILLPIVNSTSHRPSLKP